MGPPPPPISPIHFSIPRAPGPCPIKGCDSPGTFKTFMKCIVTQFTLLYYLNHILNPNFRKHSLCASMASLQFSSPFCKMLKKIIPIFKSYLLYSFRINNTNYRYKKIWHPTFIERQMLTQQVGGPIPQSGWTLRLDPALITMQIWLFHTFLYNMLTYLVQANKYFRFKCYNNTLGLNSKSF